MDSAKFTYFFYYTLFHFCGFCTVAFSFYLLPISAKVQKTAIAHALLIVSQKKKHFLRNHDNFCSFLTLCSYQEIHWKLSVHCLIFKSHTCMRFFLCMSLYRFLHSSKSLIDHALRYCVIFVPITRYRWMFFVVLHMQPRCSWSSNKHILHFAQMFFRNTWVSANYS